MSEFIESFYREAPKEPREGGFHFVKCLSRHCPNSYDEVLRLDPQFPKGWFELCHINQEDRIEFVRDFWLSKIPFHLRFPEFIQFFFSGVENLEIYLIQDVKNGPYRAEMVYALQGGSTFYRAAPPAESQIVDAVRASFTKMPLPRDYLAFMEIHDGFWKTTDTTGIIPLRYLLQKYHEFQGFLRDSNLLTLEDGEIVSPLSLIPFYESFGMPYYQCFFADWYPEDEMGNVYVSKDSSLIQITSSKEKCLDKMSFFTFSDWLSFYLDPLIEV